MWPAGSLVSVNFTPSPAACPALSLLGSGLVMSPYREEPSQCVPVMSSSWALLSWPPGFCV